MLKADDNEKAISIEELQNSQLQTYLNTLDHSTAQTKETIIYQQQNSSLPTPTPIKMQSNQKNPFYMHTKLNIIPSDKKEELNLQYLTTYNGALKLAQVFLGFIGFILSLCTDRRSTSSAWTEHITFETSLVVCAFIIGYVVFPQITITNEKTNKGLMIVEIIFYGSNTICYFISVWLMIHLSASTNIEGKGAAIMATLFCVALCILYLFETITKFKEWSGNNLTTNNIQKTENYQKKQTTNEHTNV